MTQVSLWRRPALRYGVAGVLILLMLICLRAAWWQYQRAQEKNHAQETLTKARSAPAISWQQLTQNFEPQAARFYRLQLVGRWLPASKSIGIENYIWNNLHGVLWLVPFQPINTEAVIMIALAWHPNAIKLSQDHLPLTAFGIPRTQPSASSSLVRIEGIIDLARFQRLSLGEDAIHSRSWLTFTPEKYHKRFGIRVSSYLIWAQQLIQNGTVIPSKPIAPWQAIVPKPDFSPTKHWIYVVQWLIFSMVAMVCAFLVVKRG